MPVMTGTIIRVGYWPAVAYQAFHPNRRRVSPTHGDPHTPNHFGDSRVAGRHCVTVGIDGGSLGISRVDSKE